MKIAYLCQSYPPMISGASLVVQRHAKGMVDAGHECMVMCASDTKRPYVSWSHGVQVVRMRSTKNPLRDQQRFVLWPGTEISSQLETFGPDIIHFHGPVMSTLFGLGLIKQPERTSATILTLHQLPWFVSSSIPILGGGIEKILWKIGTLLLKSLNTSISPSESIADIVNVHAKHRPIVISNGIDLERFSAIHEFPGEKELLRQKYGLDSSRPIILYVGRVDTDKQVDLLIQTAALAMRSVDAQLLVVGSGRRLPHIIKLAKDLGIQQWCHFPGFVSPLGDLPGLYRLGAVFCTTSVVEIQSSVVLEAAATGLPIVAFRASSMPEFVTDGVTGYLVPQVDTTIMAERIVDLLQNQERAKIMGQEGLRIAQRHSQAHSIKAFEKLYESLLN